MPNGNVPHLWVEIPWIIDRRIEVMYLILNQLKDDWASLVKIGPDEAFRETLAKHVSAYVKKGVMPPEEISTAILNIADDVMAGRNVTLRAGDYIAIRNFMR